MPQATIGARVGVVRPDHRVELRSVKLGRDLGQTVEILARVSPDDRVVLNPSDSLVAGAVVRVAAPGNSGKAGEVSKEEL